MKTATIQKYLGFLAAILGIAVVIPTSSQAFTSVTTQTFTSAATVSGGTAAMSVSIRNVSNNAVASQINWAAAAGAGWTQANQYLQIVSTLTVGGAGIQTYTDNRNPSASPRYGIAPSPTTPSPAGLVNAGNTSGAPVPTAWQIVSVDTVPVTVDDPNCTGAVTQPAFCTAGGRTPTGYAWFYHEDKSQVPNNAGVTTTFANAASYITMEQAGNPPQIQFAQSSFGNSTSNTNNVYLEGNFQNALGGSSYGTSTLTVELFTN